VDAEQAVNRNESASKLNFVHGCTLDLKQRAANKRMSGARTGTLGLGLQLKWTQSSPQHFSLTIKQSKRIQQKKDPTLKQKEWQTVTESVGIMKHDRTRKWSRLKFMTRCSCQRSGLRLRFPVHCPDTSRCIVHSARCTVSWVR